MKTCSKCRSVKPYSMFNIDRSNIDGLHGHCKECRRNTQIRHKIKLYKVGQCTCGKPVDQGHKACRPCLDRRHDNYKVRQSKGICPCGLPLMQGMSKCAGCLTKNKIILRARAKRHRERGLCNCGRKRVVGGATCEKCRAASRKNADRACERRHKVKKLKEEHMRRMNG